MFAAAALFVGCTQAPKVATPQQVDSIYNALKSAKAAAAEEVQVAYDIMVEGTENIDSAACVARAEEQKAAIVAAADTTNEAFKAEFLKAVKDFEAALNAPAKEEAAK